VLGHAVGHLLLTALGESLPASLACTVLPTVVKATDSIVNVKVVHIRTKLYNISHNLMTRHNWPVRTIKQSASST
jgi:hypothetical protein